MPDDIRDAQDAIRARIAGERVWIYRDKIDGDFYGFYLESIRSRTYKLFDIHTDALHNLVGSEQHKAIAAGTEGGKRFLCYLSFT